MSEFIDPLRDPRFPKRPQHPDFWKLSSAINWFDGQAGEGKKDVTEIVATMIDFESLTYTALQRVRFALRQVGRPDANVEELAFMIAIYMDAWALGYRYAEEKARA